MPSPLNNKTKQNKAKKDYGRIVALLYPLLVAKAGEKRRRRLFFCVLVKQRSAITSDMPFFSRFSLFLPVVAWAPGKQLAAGLSSHSP